MQTRQAECSTVSCVLRARDKDGTASVNPGRRGSSVDVGSKMLIAQSSLLTAVGSPLTILLPHERVASRLSPGASLCHSFAVQGLLQPSRPDPIHRADASTTERGPRATSPGSQVGRAGASPVTCCPPLARHEEALIERELHLLQAVALGAFDLDRGVDATVHTVELIDQEVCVPH